MTVVGGWTADELATIDGTGEVEVATRRQDGTLCTDGVGLVGTRDGKTVVLRPGESVWTPAGEVHFHGGTAENMMCHYAILDGGVALEVRELLTFSMLLALGGADDQVRGHVNGNLTVGNTREKLLAVLTVLVPFIGYPAPSTASPLSTRSPAADPTRATRTTRSKTWTTDCWDGPVSRSARCAWAP
jgi:alkylhydroperoxidase/carboxymuconolactone decarboxylase family protein YurZ